jgi:two-component system phosphate regulon sensor histidine kinase PhoR
MFMTANLSSAKRDNPTGNTSLSLPVSEMRGLADVLQTTVQNVGALLEVEGCSVALLDTEQNKLVTLATFQKQGRISLITQFQEIHDVASWVAEHREALVINNASHDPRFKHLDPALTGSVVFVPLIDRDNFIGILTVCRTDIEAFSSHELHLLTIFAEQAMLTIINVHQAELARRDTAHMKAQFISMITHELRSPLNSINGYLDLALEGIAGELNQQQREFVQRARAGSEHLYALIENLLLISRADAGQLRLNRDLIRLPEIVANAIEELELIAMDNEITIRVEIASDFPQIYADAVRMQQVLRNLINNALCFTPPGGSVTISARVNSNPIETTAAASIETNEDQQQIEVQIRDTGYGIAPEYQEQIFDRFYQLPGVNARRVSGQGLGLAIVKMIVELHGGRVSVESMPSAGSAFKFTLPL